MKRTFFICLSILIIICACKKDDNAFIGKDIYFKLACWPVPLPFREDQQIDSITISIYSCQDPLQNLFDTITGCTFHDEFLLLPNTYMQGITFNKTFLTIGDYKAITLYSRVKPGASIRTSDPFKLKENGELSNVNDHPLFLHGDTIIIGCLVMI